MSDEESDEKSDEKMLNVKWKRYLYSRPSSGITGAVFYKPLPQKKKKPWLEQNLGKTQDLWKTWIWGENILHANNKTTQY